MAISLVRDGEAITLSFEDVALDGDDFGVMTDTVLKARVARHFDEPEDQYDDYRVDRYPGPTFVIRKKAVYGDMGKK